MAKRKGLVRAYRMVEKPQGREAYTPAGRPLPLYHRAMNHSAGFNWGYGGSGPAQLAWCLLYHCTRDDVLTASAYQYFKRDVIAGQTQQRWGVSPRYIERYLNESRSDGSHSRPIWVSEHSVWCADWLATLPLATRDLILAMIEDGAVNPLADLVAESTGMERPLTAAAILVEGRGEGEVAV